MYNLQIYIWMRLNEFGRQHTISRWTRRVEDNWAEKKSAFIHNFRSFADHPKHGADDCKALGFCSGLAISGNAWIIYTITVQRKPRHRTFQTRLRSSQSYNEIAHNTHRLALHHNHLLFVDLVVVDLIGDNKSPEQSVDGRPPKMMMLTKMVNKVVDSSDRLWRPIAPSVT